MENVLELRIRVGPLLRAVDEKIAFQTTLKVM